MKVTGIIAEYDPFHSGHAYQIDTLKTKRNTDYVVVVMSGDFVQRGSPAIIDKFTRTKAALSAGADLVLSLPVALSLSSAEYFAKGGVNLLDSLGVVTDLCYGCESINTELSNFLTNLFVTEPKLYRELLTAQLRKGVSYPAARSNACLSYIETYAPHLMHDKEDARRYLSSPNNILALEYEKAILCKNSSINGAPLLREGSSFHNEELLGQFASASAIRRELKDHGINATSIKACTDYMPDVAGQLFDDYLIDHEPLFVDDFSSALQYKLRLDAIKGYTPFIDCSIELSNRIQNNIEEFTCISEFTKQLNTKESTHTRIARTLMHIMLNLTDQSYSNLERTHFVPYARVLGMNRNAGPLLHQIKANASVPLMTSVADGRRSLNQYALGSLQEDLLARDIYRDVLRDKCGKLLPNDYLQSPILSNDSKLPSIDLEALHEPTI